MHIYWDKLTPDVSDADVETAKRLWELGKTRRLPDGTKPQTVRSMEEVERNSFYNAIKVGRIMENQTYPSSRLGAATPNEGSDGNTEFDPHSTAPFEDHVPRDPESSIAHEAHHLYRMNKGQHPLEDSAQQDEELAARAVENEHREAKGIKQRELSGTRPVPQSSHPAPEKPAAESPSSNNQGMTPEKSQAAPHAEMATAQQQTSGGSTGSSQPAAESSQEESNDD